MKMVIGSDHCGFHLKKQMIPFLESLDYEVVDIGCYTEEKVDFPDIVRNIGEKLVAKECERSIVFCGTGIGAAIAGNKIKGIRAAVCHDTYSAHQCVEHDNVNLMCLGGKIVSEWLAEDLIRSFINANFSDDDDFRRRVAKLDEMDR
ncbi:RpiB/LacA/LacB family sugar-phosphate isomerase [Gracilibacillus salitolerans]|uniref:RpiB/LacA/LacB family sugar-phosphate isomerase n=1 Tax=Gracilibacillus salitolerans TaxID=2663022 RepID=A0A5Q2TMC7_9BACI|nr:RpiB/LacA/LacB family sugar-phosphate isomerase [Gracilibacillus salitolerans]QGH36104.1 RpiB/LacA/LacB family sugar-phosphate isomerase [Gracilibacillus salitolerans]